MDQDNGGATLGQAGGSGGGGAGSQEMSDWRKLVHQVKEMMVESGISWMELPEVEAAVEKVLSELMLTTQVLVEPVVLEQARFNYRFICMIMLVVAEVVN